jgi:RNA polymerase sigma factor (sigma-70 family)
MVGSKETETGRGARCFPPTSVSLLQLLNDSAPGPYDESLHRLIALYWKPVYSLIRRLWGKGNEEAKDLTQSFFLDAVVDGGLARRYDARRGSFRTYLKAAVTYYIRDDARSAGRIKRGGGAKTLSLHFDDAELERIEPADPRASPEEAFDRAWRDQVLVRAKELLKRRLGAQGKELYFQAFRRYDLEESTVSYRTVAKSLGVAPDTVKFFLRHCRDEFRRAVGDVVSEYAHTPELVEQEMEELLNL